MNDVITFLLPPFCACVLMISIFGYLGIHVLKREIIFIDIALAQIAAVGATLAFILFGVEEHSPLAFLFAFLFTILAALFYSQIGRRIVNIPIEAIIGVSYAIAAATALFMLAMAAGGDVHLENMLTGSILWIKWNDIFILGLVCAIVGFIHIIFRKKLIIINRHIDKTDPQQTSALWDFLFYVTLGMVITFSVRIAGVLVIFGFLIIPATISAFFVKTWKNRLLITWMVGLLSIVCGLAFSYRFDFSCGPSVVMFLGLFFIIAAVLSNFIHPALANNNKEKEEKMV